MPAAIPKRLQPADVADFAARIEARLGHEPDERRRDDLRHLLEARLTGTGSATYAAYVLLLEAGVKEWQALAPLLTVPETYFFRMPAHFDALALEALPRLIAANSKTRSLRILSAGCASGEEAYSLRILLDERFPQLRDWRVEIVGIDLSEAALLRARAGVYTEWSLRATSEPRRRANFEPAGKGFRLLSAPRAGVRFQVANLMQPVPTSDAQYDVVFCRNVLIYFSEAAMRDVVSRLADRLAPGGYLFLGPAESLRGVSSDFELCHRHDAFFYQKKGGSRKGAQQQTASNDSVRLEDARARANVETQPPASQPAGQISDRWFDAIRISSERLQSLVAPPKAAARKPSAPKPSAPKRPSRAAGAQPPQPLADSLPLLIQEQRFTDALALLDSAEAAAPAAEQGAQHLLRAVLLTNVGRFEEAVRECALTLATNETEPGAYYLLGVCREQLGELPEAQSYLEQAVYLAPNFSMAHLRRAALARRMGQAGVAERAFRSALTALAQDDDMRLQLFAGGLSRAGLEDLCRRELAQLGGRMSAADYELQLQQLRQQFDESFSQPPPAQAEARRDFILVAAGGRRIALELDGVNGLQGLERGLTVVPLPSDAAAVLGIAALKGTVLPVFDLGVLLGGAAVTQAWWSGPVLLHVQTAAADSLGLAFEHLLHFARVPAAEVYTGADGTHLQYQDELYPVVLLPDLLLRITGPAGHHTPERENA